MSLIARPSLATSVRSASSGPSSALARPSATASEAVRHAAPVAREESVIARRPGAAMPIRIVSPRITARRAESMPIGGSSVPA